MRGETSWMMFQASAEPGMANQRRPQHENCGDLDSVGGNHLGMPRRQGSGGETTASRFHPGLQGGMQEYRKIIVTNNMLDYNEGQLFRFSVKSCII